MKLTVEDMVRRSATRYGWDARFPVWIMRWGMVQGIVRCSIKEGVRIWTMLLPQVVFVPRGSGYLDTRQPQATFGLPFASLVSREEKYRLRLMREKRFDRTKRLLELLSTVDQDTAVPSCLRGADYPPVETMGEFRENLSSYLDEMPAWRLDEACFIVSELAVVSKIENSRAAEDASLALLGCIEFS